MKIYNYIKIILTICIIALSATAFASPERCICSNEYKLMLKPALFKLPNQDYQKFWNIVEKTISAQGLTMHDKEKIYKPRSIFYLDTDSFSIMKQNFIVRIRGKYIKLSNEWPQANSKTELTLKYRSPSLASASRAPVEAVSDLDWDISTEEDTSIKNNQLSSVFSRSTKVYEPGFIPITVKEITQYFPAFAQTKLDLKSKLSIVNNIHITEKRIRPGYIFICGKKIKTLFSFWYKNDQSVPFVAEFSFKLKLKEGTTIASKIFSIKRAADNFFLSLSQNSKIFLIHKQTKTGIVYSQ